MGAITDVQPTLFNLNINALSRLTSTGMIGASVNNEFLEEKIADRDYSTGYAATTDDAEIRDKTELVRDQHLFSWSVGPSVPVHLARLERISSTTVRVQLVTSVP